MRKTEQKEQINAPLSNPKTSVRKILDKRKNKSGLCKVVVEIFTYTTYSDNRTPSRQYTRLDTGIQIKLEHWSDAKSEVMSKDHDFNEKNRVINSMFAKIQHYVENLNDQHNRHDIETEYKQLRGLFGDSRELTVIDYFKDFIKFKERELQNKISVKDYYTCLHTLEDYQDFELQRNFRFTDISLNFFFSYRDFLSTKHPDNYRTRGGLNDNTINKRITTFKTFMKYIESEELFRFKESLKEFQVEKSKVDFVTLNTNELSDLMNLELNNSDKKIRDIFVLMCLIGIRFHDYQTFDKSEFIVNRDGSILLKKINEKTHTEINIPLVGTAVNILNQYKDQNGNFVLPTYTDQHLNREIKAICEKNNLFQEQVKINTVRNKEIKSTKHKKCELIKVHTARLTFISRCISEGMPLNEIMAMTGHSQITTLNKYVRAQPPKNMAKTDLYIKNPIYKDNKSMAFEEIDDSLEL